MGGLRILQAIYYKTHTGQWWDYKKSNLFIVDNDPDNRNDRTTRVNLTYVLALSFRVLLHLAFQTFVILAFMYADYAGLNQGLMTSICGSYCVHTSILFYWIFNEKLHRKFILGIGFMILCVLLISFGHT